MVYRTLGVQTPNCIRQTVFDAVALDYETVTVIVDATAAATPGVHIGTKQYYYFFIYACFLLSWTWIGSIFFVFFFFRILLLTLCTYDTDICLVVQQTLLT